MLAPFKLAAVLAGVALPLAGALFGPRPPESLGVQQCNTECQERFTDCIDRCDGVADCQKECDRTVTACVKGCTAAPAPSGSGAPPSPPPTKPAAQAEAWTAARDVAPSPASSSLSRSPWHRL